MMEPLASVGVACKVRLVPRPTVMLLAGDVRVTVGGVLVASPMMMLSIAIIWSGLMAWLLSSAQRKYIRPLLVSGVAKRMVTVPLFCTVACVEFVSESAFTRVH